MLYSVSLICSLVYVRIPNTSTLTIYKQDILFSLPAATPIINVYCTAVSLTMKIKYNTNNTHFSSWSSLDLPLDSFFTDVVFITSSGETLQRLIHEDHHSSGSIVVIQSYKEMGREGKIKSYYQNTLLTRAARCSNFPK